MKTIGVFDSGVGGITVLRALREAVPELDYIYLGDTARVPYGTKSQETVLRYSLQVGDFLVHQGIDLLVVACNTATAYGLHEIRARYDIPVIGVIDPGVQATVAATTSGQIAVIGTTATINSGQYGKAIHNHLPHAQVQEVACPMLVPLAEENWCGTDISRLILQRYLEPIGSVDTLVLGCTHYPLLKDDIAQVLPGVQLVDSALQTARTIAGLVGKIESTQRGRVTWFMTDTSPRFLEIASVFLGEAVTEVEHIDL
ncbi:glutamate racemase [Desulfurispira natronophila]|uniref:Glutamate racemase n=1 Tax=Desulfurispira natronophila TaxID=682562 RepID=A0A7W7Y4C2_9BACT|nr:glutamate racemase [Desulfurispira natronophila]